MQSTCIATYEAASAAAAYRVPSGAPDSVERFSTEPSLAALSGSAVLETQRRRLHLPAPLRSPGITRLPRYYGCSDSCVSAERRPVHAGLLVSCPVPSDPS